MHNGEMWKPRSWRACLAACAPAGSVGACKLVIIMKVFTASGELCFSYAISASRRSDSAAQELPFKGPDVEEMTGAPEIDGLQ